MLILQEEKTATIMSQWHQLPIKATEFNMQWSLQGRCSALSEQTSPFYCPKNESRAGAGSETHIGHSCEPGCLKSYVVLQSLSANDYNQEPVCQTRRHTPELKSVGRNIWRGTCRGFKLHESKRGGNEGSCKNISDKFSDVIIPVSAYLFACKSH